MKYNKNGINGPGLPPSRRVARLEEFEDRCFAGGGETGRVALLQAAL